MHPGGRRPAEFCHDRRRLQKYSIHNYHVSVRRDRINRFGLVLPVAFRCRLALRAARSFCTFSSLMVPVLSGTLERTTRDVAGAATPAARGQSSPPRHSCVASLQRTFLEQLQQEELHQCPWASRPYGCALTPGGTTRPAFAGA